MALPVDEVLLVDGVGRPFVHCIPANEIEPITIPCPHEGIRSGTLMVKFDRSNGEFDAWGRQIYRMRGTGLPPLRDEYLVKGLAK